MQLKPTEKKLIGIALLLLIIVAVTKSGIVTPDALSGIWPDAGGAKQKLSQALTLLSQADHIQQQAANLAQLQTALDLGTASDQTALVMQSFGKIAGEYNLTILEFKPGIGKPEAGLWVLPVQVRVKGNLNQFMTLLTDLRQRVPMMRIPQMTVAPADRGTIEANFTLETLFAHGDQNQNLAKSKLHLIPLSASQKQDYLQWLRDRVGSVGLLSAITWDRLRQAFHSDTVSGPGDKTDIIPDQPRLVGIVNLDHSTQALIALGSDSWYFKPGQSQGGIRVLTIGAQMATVQYQGSIMQLMLNQDFPLTPLDTEGRPKNKP